MVSRGPKATTCRCNFGVDARPEGHESGSGGFARALQLAAQPEPDARGYIPSQGLSESASVAGYSVDADLAPISLQGIIPGAEVAWYVPTYVCTTYIHPSLVRAAASSNCCRISNPRSSWWRWSCPGPLVGLPAGPEAPTATTSISRDAKRYLGTLPYSVNTEQLNSTPNHRWRHPSQVGQPASVGAVNWANTEPTAGRMIDDGRQYTPSIVCIEI